MDWKWRRQRTNVAKVGRECGRGPVRPRGGLQNDLEELFSCASRMYLDS
jgi:hypothetical protein